MKIIEKTQGDEHLDTSFAQNNLGELLRTKGDYEGAEPLLRKALFISEKNNGSEHPVTGTRLNNLGLVLQIKHDYQSAEAMYRKALAISEETEGPEHPFTGIRLNNLGTLLQDMHDYDAAEQMYRRALMIAEKTQGPQHAHTAARLHNLGDLLRTKGEYAAAGTLLERALTIREKVLGPSHIDTASTLWQLGNTLVDQEKVDEGLQNILRSLEYFRAIFEMQWGEKNPHFIGVIRYRLGEIYKNASRYKESREEFQLALEIFESKHTRNSTEVAEVLTGMGKVEALQGDFVQAQKFFAEALEINLEVSPDNVEDIENRLNAAREGKVI